MRLRPSCRSEAQKAVSLVALVALVIATAEPLGQAPPEAELKAALVYKLVRFVEWPEGALRPAAPVDVCVAGNESVRTALVAYAPRQPTGDRPVAVHRYDPARAQGCHVVFIGADSDQLDAIFRANLAKPVLTVGESVGFADRGGMVNLVRDGRHIRLEVNRDSVSRAGLSISSLVLSLARTAFR